MYAAGHWFNVTETLTLTANIFLNQIRLHLESHIGPRTDFTMSWPHRSPGFSLANSNGNSDTVLDNPGLIEGSNKIVCGKCLSVIQIEDFLLNSINNKGFL